MHPDISTFPNKYFYQGQLSDAVEMAGRCQRSWHGQLGVYRFYEILGRESVGRMRSGKQGFSLYNEPEAEAVVDLIKSLAQSSPNINVI